MDLLKKRAIKREFIHNYNQALEIMESAHRCITRICNVYWQHALTYVHSQSPYIVKYNPNYEAKNFKKTIKEYLAFCKKNFNNLNQPCLANFKNEISSLNEFLVKIEESLSNAMTKIEHISNYKNTTDLFEAYNALDDLLIFIKLVISKQCNAITGI